MVANSLSWVFEVFGEIKSFFWWDMEDGEHGEKNCRGCGEKKCRIRGEKKNDDHSKTVNRPFKWLWYFKKRLQVAGEQLALNFKPVEMDQRHMSNNNDREKGKYSLIKDSDDFQQGLYDKPLPCFGCGIGWFSFLIGFAFPLMWFYATFLYFGNYYRKDPRERAGLAASAIAAMGCSVILFIVVMVLVFGGR
ncbi:unnamed protein product [Lactuca virosa]|uniref:Ribosomal protein L18ae family n=1 Tax=Lactuca virosa TaxID=75947 RepID=A0AAU9MM30_9ASTR|nr:unnamed protein product [Lactuca virosa]